MPLAAALVSASMPRVPAIQLATTVPFYDLTQFVWTNADKNDEQCFNLAEFCRFETRSANSYRTFAANWLNFRRCRPGIAVATDSCVNVPPTASSAHQPLDILLPGSSGPLPALGPFADLLLESNAALGTDLSMSDSNSNAGSNETGSSTPTNALGQSLNGTSSPAQTANPDSIAPAGPPSLSDALAALASAIEASLTPAVQNPAGSTTPLASGPGKPGGRGIAGTQSATSGRPDQPKGQRNAGSTPGQIAFPVPIVLPNPSDKVFLGLAPGVLLKGYEGAPTSGTRSSSNIGKGVEELLQAANAVKSTLEATPPLAFTVQMAGTAEAGATLSGPAVTSELSSTPPPAAAPASPSGQYTAVQSGVPAAEAGLSTAPQPADAAAPDASRTLYGQSTRNDGSSTQADIALPAGLNHGDSSPFQGQPEDKNQSQSDSGDSRSPAQEHSGAGVAFAAAAVHDGATVSSNSSRDAAPPSQPAAPQAQPDPASQAGKPTREIALRLGQEDAPTVSVQLVDRNGRLQVAVRTHDAELSGRLQTNLDQLVNSLKQQGVEAETWSPARTESRNFTDASQSQYRQSQGESDNGGQTGHSHQRQRRQRRYSAATQSSAPFASNLNL